jgi:molybdopterin molybdotransferase
MTLPATPASLQAIAASIQGYDPKALPVAQAQAFIAQMVQSLVITDAERVPLMQALGRVLAAEVVSPIDVPAHDNSAMDGFALASADLTDAAANGENLTLKVVCSTLAGAPYGGTVNRGEAVRITTGAVMPSALDTVVPLEFAHVQGDSVTFPASVVRAGDNRRLRGEDLARGKPAVLAGRVLRPAELGLIASLGIGEVLVRRRLRVAFFSTGDEIASIGEPLAPGHVYDSNRYTIHAMLLRLGVQPIDMGVVRDNPAALEAAFVEASTRADVVITSGGVSVGEADHTKQIMAKLGDVLFWRIAMRPGRPMAIGRLKVAPNVTLNDTLNVVTRETVLFGLPGNPVAVMVTFYAFVRDALLQMSGAALQPLLAMRIPCATPVRKKPGRTEYQRGIVSVAADGTQTVAITGNQGSGVLSSMSAAHGLIVLHHDQGNVEAGDLVDVVGFDGLM